MANPHPRDRALIALYTIINAKSAGWHEFSTQLKLQLSQKMATDFRAYFCHQYLFGMEDLCRQESIPPPLEKLNLALSSQLTDDLIDKSLSLDVVESSPGLMQVWNQYATVSPNAYTLSPGPGLVNADFNLINHFVAGLIDFWKACLSRLDDMGDLDKDVEYLETIQGMLGQILH
jgi:hypothetical protein